MSNKFQDICIKNHTYCLSMILSIYPEILIQKNVKIDEKSNKNILIYFIRYGMIKNLKHVKISFVNRLYHIFSEVNGYFEEINKSKYLTLFPTNESKEIIKNRGTVE